MGRAKKILPERKSIRSNIMIFVSVGTHEQPFNRLINEINRLTKEKIVTEDIFIQAGYCSNVTPLCKFENFISIEEMDACMNEARIIIIHGGLGSIFQSLMHKKIPIVVPRQKKFMEHVDDHQVINTEMLLEKKKIIRVLDIMTLGKKIISYETELKKLGVSGDPSMHIEKNSRLFSEKLEKICQELVWEL